MDKNFVSTTPRALGEIALDVTAETGLVTVPVEEYRDLIEKALTLSIVKTLLDIDTRNGSCFVNAQSIMEVLGMRKAKGGEEDA